MPFFLQVPKFSGWENYAAGKQGAVLAVGSSCTALTVRAWTDGQQSSHQELFRNLQCLGGKTQRSLCLLSLFCLFHFSLSQLERQSLCFSSQFMEVSLHFSLGTNLLSGQNRWAMPCYRGPGMLRHLHSPLSHSSPCFCPTALFLQSTYMWIAS